METRTPDSDIKRYRVIAVDPDLQTPGVATFEHGRLQRAEVVELRGERVEDGACYLAGVLLGRHGTPEAAQRPAALLRQEQVAALGGVVVEGQFIGRFGGGAAGAFLSLAYQAGAVSAALASAGYLPHRVMPEAWQELFRARPGQRKLARGKNALQCGILAALMTSERAHIPRGAMTGRYLSEAVDAVGIGLWAIGRAGHRLADPAEFILDVDQDPPKRAPKPRGKAQGALPGVGG